MVELLETQHSLHKRANTYQKLWIFSKTKNVL